MKRISLIVGLSVIIVTAAVVGLLNLPGRNQDRVTPSPEQSAVVAEVNGNVSVLIAAAIDWVEALVGVELNANDRIRTGDESSALLTFFEGSTVDLSSNTEVNIEELSQSLDTGSTTISLEQTLGRTGNRVKKLIDSDSSYEIKTPSGTAVARGTEFFVDVLWEWMAEYQTWEANRQVFLPPENWLEPGSSDNETSINGVITVVTVTEGTVAVTARGETVTVNSGEQTVIYPGQPPTEPAIGTGGRVAEIDVPETVIPGLMPETAGTESPPPAIAETATQEPPQATTTQEPPPATTTPGPPPVLTTKAPPLPPSNYGFPVPPPAVVFAADILSGKAPLTVQFTDLSQDFACLWEFGDSTISTDRNPRHTYNTPGSYTVKLTIYAAGDSGSKARTAYIVVFPDPGNKDSTTIILTVP